MTDENFEKEIAEMVIRPKLQKVVRETPGIANKAELRKAFLEAEGVTVSAAKFEEYLRLLGISFKKQVIIEGLDVGWCGDPPRPQAGAETPDEDFRFDNEKPEGNTYADTHNRAKNPRDMFGLA